MSRMFTWICIVVGIVGYRLFSNTATTFEEHVAGVYFSGFALFIHWLSWRWK